jgi:aminoglycoside phosphotransferase (APT) family kinase protein
VIADADLRGALELALGDAVTRLERRPSEYSSSFALEELDVALESGRELELMFKDVGRREPAVAAAKPDFLYDPLREIEVYREVLEPAKLGTPRFHGADTERGWLFIERVRGVELFQVGSRATWEAVARWLAGAHAVLAAAAERAPRAIRYDREYLERWPRRALEHARARGDAEAEEVLTRVVHGYDDVVDRLLGLPTTLIHGEFYASNVLVDRFTDPIRTAPVDWEQAGVGPALVDLAALTAGRWTDEHREAIASAYGEGAGASVDSEGLEAGRLHLAVQWLGWSRDWSPPPQHRHDWLKEALHSAEKLGL